MKSVGVVRARDLRQNQTEAEKKLWWRLRNRQIEGVKFRRQERIEGFIVDFCSVDPKIIVEVDGAQHGDPEAEDAKRTEFLQRAGYRVIRFWNHEVLEDIDRVVEQVADAVARLQRW